ANTGLPTSENYGINAQFNLIDIATNKSVMTGTTASRVSYDVPGTFQRYARARAFHDAEDRASQESPKTSRRGSPLISSQAPETSSARGESRRLLDSLCNSARCGYAYPDITGIK